MSDEDYEWAKGIRDIFRGIYEDRVIAMSEESLAQTPDFANMPMPNTTHPAFAHIPNIPAHMTHFKIHRINYHDVYASEVTYPTAEDGLLATVIVTRKKCWAPAPFVGDWRMNDAVYIWPVWVDDYGRYIAGDSVLTWRYP